MNDSLSDPVDPYTNIENNINNMNKSSDVNVIKDSTSSESDNKINNNNFSKIYILMFFLTLIISGIYFVYKFPDKLPSILNVLNINYNKHENNQSDLQKNTSLKKFSSFEEFKNYMEISSQQIGGMFGVVSQGQNLEAPELIQNDISGAVPKMAETSPGTLNIDRYSGTNVQVIGIDEPDIVKTDGKNLFISNLNQYYYQTGLEIPVSPVTSNSSSVTQKISNIDTESIYKDTRKTSIVEAFPIEAIGKKSEIDKTGEMFLENNVLVIISGNIIYGYDVSDASNPKELWNFEFDSNQYILSTRLKENKIFIASRTNNYGSACDIPLSSGVLNISVNCMDIYHPGFLVPADSIFTILKLDLKSGKVENKNSFVGSSGLSVFYMSSNNIYLTYTYYEDFVSIFYDFYENEGKGLLPESVMAKLKNLKGLDISVQSKLTELSLILENYKQSLGSDDLLKIETETQNKLSEYLKKKVRSFEHSGIVKINSSNLEVVSTGNVPGKPLNQFSMDEYQNNLRIAVTVGDGMFSNYSINDVYILDKDLRELGKITDMGIGEKIYSVRFIDNVGYVVTFRQTDPFYVFDLKNAKDPKKTGELKIPGYSSYLHKVDNNLILGVGMENSKVKLSLFDVSDTSNPIEISKYSLDEYWTDVSNNHHAFLQDERNKIVFIPGGKGGYIISYKDNNLSLLKAVSETGIKRALYINNFFYLVGNNKITVLEENDWKTIKSLSL